MLKNTLEKIKRIQTNTKRNQKGNSIGNPIGDSTGIQ
jgi:hypothetical protein